MSHRSNTHMGFLGVHTEADASTDCQVERAEGRRQGSLPSAGVSFICCHSAAERLPPIL